MLNLIDRLYEYCAMRTLLTLVAILAIGTSLPVVSQPAIAVSSNASAHLAHENYVAAINSNNLESLLGMLTDDVVFMAPNDKPYAGKAAVRPWLAAYLKAYKTHWDKPVQEFVVNGEWAFERYSYTSTDTPQGAGAPVVDTGWGFVVYHHDADGRWRVARDGWGSNHPPAK